MAGGYPPGAHPPAESWWRRLLAARWLLLVVGSTAALVLFGVLGDEILEPGANVVDRVARSWVLLHQSSPALAAAHILTDVGSPGGTVALGVAVSVWLWVRRRRRVAAMVVSAPIAATGGFAGLKSLFGRAGPGSAHARPEPSPRTLPPTRSRAGTRRSAPPCGSPRRTASGGRG
jgi:hypothetical protein